MKTLNIISMQEHPVKAIIASFIGLFAGAHTLLDAPVVQTHIQELMTFGVACAKAFTIGGFAWAGQTAMAWTRRKIIKVWRNRK